jgi:3-hydroxyisobutyrate dehydrogenase-like beta-hydroxyacid dehydrogenase
MDGAQQLKTVAILMPGDMGHGCAIAFRESGIRVITALDGRSADTHKRAVRAGLEILPSLEDVVISADLILSILPPEYAVQQAERVAAAMRIVEKSPDYADCNAISPETAKTVASVFDKSGANFIDAGIIGHNPVKEKGGTRLYVSGGDRGLICQLDGRGMLVRDLGAEVGRASTMKMIYASSTKGAFSLFAAVAIMAELSGLRDELFKELAESRPATLASIETMVPRIPLDAKRWIFEMDEIARTYAANGMTPDFHTGAGTIMRLAAQTPLSAETRETARDDHDLADVLASYVTALKQQKK